MRKNLFFVAALAMAMASCSNDEVTELTQSNAISFRSSLENASRAVTTANNLSSFKVHSFEGVTEYFTDEVEPNDGRTVWNTKNDTYYWPTGNKLSFAGYAPVNFGATVSSTTGTDNAISTSISKTGYTINSNADEDVIVAYTKDAEGPNSVNMNFRHALSQIVIQAKNSSSIYTVDITEVKIANVQNKGDFSFAPTATTSAATDENPLTTLNNVWSNLTYSTTNTPASYTRSHTTAVSLSPLTPSTDATSETTATATLLTGTTGAENPFLLLPQTLTGATFAEGNNGTYISVKCKIYKDGGEDGTDIVIFPKKDDTATETVEYGESAIALSGTWEPGKKYTYTLNFLGKGGNGGQNPEDGENILNPITFYVSVDQWSEQTETTLDMKKTETTGGDSNGSNDGE